MPKPTRAELGQLIADRLERETGALQTAWMESKPVRHAVIDDLLPEDVASEISKSFPALDKLMQRSSLRERKKVGVAIEQYDPLVGEILFAFHEQPVIDAVSRVTGIPGMVADPSLYASGVSAMAKDDFLNPHLDNSHDGDRERYRVLNLLYYISPDWAQSNGGNLEVWDPQVKTPTEIVSKFNRLVLMHTNRTSWHSVNKVQVERARLCVSNYYFSATSPDEQDFSHVTTFAGRPEETIKRAVLNVDGMLLNAVGKAFPSLTRSTRHRRQADQPAGDQK